MMKLLQPSKQILCLFLCVLPLFIHRAYAEGTSTPAPRSLAAIRTEAPPIIDGVLNEDCWAGAVIATDFTDRKTDAPAKNQTRVHILYDDRFLYLGFECDEPDPKIILATERKDDRSLWADDHIVVQLDTFHDRRSTYDFATNPLGVRTDAKRGVFGYNQAWDADWKVACKTNTSSWAAEMAIPIGDMLFDRRDGVVWGINFHRNAKGAQEESTWCYDPDGRGATSPSSAGELTGLDLSETHVNHRPQFETYVSGTASTGGADSEISTGLDLTLRLGPKVTSAFTINPDYGQIEADADTIELRDTERFLPEQRPFFKEGAEIFSTPIDVYYSRRFSDIDVGMKATGNDADSAFGVMGVKGVVNQNGSLRDGAFFLARYNRNILEDSQAGFIFADSEREDGTANRVAGLDTRLQLSTTTAFTGQALGLVNEQKTTLVDPNGYEHEKIHVDTEHALYTELSGGKKPFWWHMEFRDISPEFVPEFGYVTRRDIIGPSAGFDHYREPLTGPIKEYYAGMYCSMYDTHAGEKFIRNYEEWCGMLLRNEVGFNFYRSDEYRAPYTNHTTSVGVNYNSADKYHSFGMNFSKGVYEDIPYTEISSGKPFQLHERLTSSISGTLRREDRESGEADVWLWRWANEYTFSWDARIKFTMEQNSQQRHNFTIMFSWEVNAALDFHVVITDSGDGEGESTQGAFMKVVRRF